MSAQSAPLLSIGLPVYNGETWIADAIESFLEQSFTDFELVISDNCSTDSTAQICQQFADRDKRVRYHCNPSNIGLHRNFDRAFALSTGKYFKWATDSDFCLDGFLEKCIAVLEERPDVVLVYARAYLLIHDPMGQQLTREYFDDFNLDDDRPSERFIKYLNREKINNVMHGIIRADAIKETSLMRPIWGSDINMVAELSLIGKFVEVPERLFVRRVKESSSTLLMSNALTQSRQIQRRQPSYIGRLKLHVLRFASVFKAPISQKEKLRLFTYLAKSLCSACLELGLKVAAKLIKKPVKVVFGQ